MAKNKKLIGIIASGVVLLLGLIMMIVGFSAKSEVYYGGTYTSSASFGADFYTYQHEATANAANNINSLGNAVEDLGDVMATVIVAIAFLIIAIGLVSMAYFLTRKAEIAQAAPVMINEPVEEAPAQPAEETATVCANCGAPLDASYAFCMNCGTPVAAPEA